jgi:hypothetical protein
MPSGGRSACPGRASNELTRRNMDLFAAEVMPHFRG